MQLESPSKTALQPFLRNIFVDHPEKGIEKKKFGNTKIQSRKMESRNRKNGKFKNRENTVFKRRRLRNQNR